MVVTVPLIVCALISILGAETNGTDCLETGKGEVGISEAL